MSAAMCRRADHVGIAFDKFQGALKSFRGLTVVTGF
jgi:hypothetical protein